MSFLTRSFFPRYGRLSMIFCAVASPIPGNVINSCFDAELMSMISVFVLLEAVVLEAGGSDFLPSVFPWAKAEPVARHTMANRSNRRTDNLSFIFAMLLLIEVYSSLRENIVDLTRQVSL